MKVFKLEYFDGDELRVESAFEDLAERTVSNIFVDYDVIFRNVSQICRTLKTKFICFQYIKANFSIIKQIKYLIVSTRL